MSGRPSDYKKIKHGQLPGDYPKAVKIRMREKGEIGPTWRYSFDDGTWITVRDWEIGSRAAKVFKRDYVRAKERAVLRRRARQEIEDQLELAEE